MHKGAKKCIGNVYHAVLVLQFLFFFLSMNYIFTLLLFDLF